MTIFQKIIDREIPAEIVYEDELCLAFNDIQPQAPVHILVIPKRPIVNIASVGPTDEHILGHLLVVCGQLARELNIDESGYRIVTNTNENGGQSVYHLHLHLLGGRQMIWPPG